MSEGLKESFRIIQKGDIEMPVCFACGRDVNDGCSAVSPKKGGMWFHASCLGVVELPAYKGNITLRVSFSYFGIEYVGTARLHDNKRDKAIEEALTAACNKTVAYRCRTPRGGNRGMWSRRGPKAARAVV